jgi:hypothetical protein
MYGVPYRCAANWLGVSLRWYVKDERTYLFLREGKCLLLLPVNMVFPTISIVKRQRLIRVCEMVAVRLRRLLSRTQCRLYYYGVDRVPCSGGGVQR